MENKTEVNLNSVFEVNQTKDLFFALKADSKFWDNFW